MNKQTKQNIVMAVVGLIIVFLIDYSRVSLCDGVAIPYKCENYLEHYGIE